ncbi:BON domain-containing protein [Pararhodospirillum photometricum]|nr:BON domain-containing protein [Pararhodospirillum photometricum]
MRACAHAWKPGLLLLAGLAGLTALTSGCAPVALLGAGAKTASAASEERGLGGFVDDAAIQTALNGKLFTTNEALFSAVDLTVREGRVLMTGSVPRAEDRLTATRLAWEVTDVREVINELTLRDKNDAVDSGRDLVLSNRLQASLLFATDIRSANYTVDVVNGVVYVMGVAQDATERERVLGYARAVPHVRKVVDYTRLKGEPVPAGGPRS